MYQKMKKYILKKAQLQITVGFRTLADKNLLMSQVWLDVMSGQFFYCKSFHSNNELKSVRPHFFFRPRWCLGSTYVISSEKNICSHEKGKSLHMQAKNYNNCHKL